MIIGASVAAGTAVLLYFLPLFHVVPLDQAEQRAAGKAFDPAAFVDRFWTERLIPGADSGRGCGGTRDGRADRTASRRDGRTAAAWEWAASTTISSPAPAASSPSKRTPWGCLCATANLRSQVSLETGKIFGNAVRDGTGLLDVNDFPNSQDFNALSSEINRRIEQQVLPALRKKAAVGATVRFVGCAEIMDEDTDLHPLRIVPFIVEAP